MGVSEETSYSSYRITQFYIPRNDGPRIQIQDLDGNLREVGVSVNRNKDTNELTLDVHRHFADPDSQAWFPDSAPWPMDELLETLEE